MNTICENCGADLNEEGIGYDSHCFQVSYPDGSTGELEFGDTIEYYCPKCGNAIPDKQAWLVEDGWNGDDGWHSSKAIRE